jgi:hypothetical protein
MRTLLIYEMRIRRAHRNALRNRHQVNRACSSPFSISGHCSFRIMQIFTEV